MTKKKQEVPVETQQEVKQEPKITPPPAEPKKEAVIAMNERQQIAPSNHKELITLVQTIAAGGGFPERFKTLEMRVAAYSLARSLMAEQWQLALNHMAPIDGQMVIYGELPRTLAERTKEVKEFKVYVINEKYEEICPKNKNIQDEIFAGVCDVQRAGREKKQYFYTMDEAKKAGQYPPMKNEWKGGQKTGKKIQNMDSPWETARKVMLMRKAQAIAVKFDFPEALAGVPIAEYDMDLAPDIVDVTPTEGRAEELNKKFRGRSDA